MPSFSATLTWATAVDPVSLGAHFEAYVRLQPVFHMLRLCNRFGKGKKAAVARLPVELRLVVEDYLMEEEREKQRSEWNRCYRCWEGRCDLTDHYATQHLVNVFENHSVDYHLIDGDSDCDCAGEYDRGIGKLNKHQVGVVRKTLVEDHDWEFIHEGWKNAWEARVGRSARADRGFFTRHQELFLHDFGLKVWISHVQASRREIQQGSFPSTVAYLTLPDSGTVRKDIERRRENPEDFDIDTPWLPTESGYGLSVAPPNRPSENSLKRFPRAISMLGLTAPEKAKPVLYASREDVEEEKADEEVDTGEGGWGGPKAEIPDEDSSLPELRFLVSCEYEMDGLW